MLMKRLRRYLVAGLLVWIPLAVTYFLLRFAVNLMDRTLRVIPQKYQPGILLQELFNTDAPVHIPGLGIILTLIVLLLTGILAANFVGRAFVGGWESLMDRIPVVRSIYSAAKNFAEIVFSDSSSSFKQVMLIEYPSTQMTIMSNCWIEADKYWRRSTATNHSLLSASWKRSMID